MAKNTPESIEPGFERIPDPEVDRTRPEQAQTDELMHNIEHGTVEKPSKVIPMTEYLEKKPAQETLRISDKTQELVDEFEASKTVESSKRIMNKVLAEVEGGRIPPDEANTLIEKGQQTLEEQESRLAA